MKNNTTKKFTLIIRGEEKEVAFFEEYVRTMFNTVLTHWDIQELSFEEEK